LDSLGYAHHHLGHHQQAIAYYQRALDLRRDLGVRYFEAETLTHLGDTHHAAANIKAARDAWQDALTILEELDHLDADQVRTRLHDLNHPIAARQPPCSATAFPRPRHNLNPPIRPA
jgi:tetratricopeptide (TPR) repeat protein